ncbi:hypothetical protein T190_10270 [Sinorhizobium meliloti CCBAU 01290]|nr:hypothetical protein T190_10270 [Sinorhizobium meliloti CCBAU 01290]
MVDDPLRFITKVFTPVTPYLTGPATRPDPAIMLPLIT